MNTMLDTCRQHFFMSFSMMEKMIEQCPEDVWNMKAGGFVFWQQIVHALSGSNFWMRQDSSNFTEPFAERKIYPELDADPEGYVTRDEMTAYKKKVKAICESFFDGKDDEWLMFPSWVYVKLTNLDVLLMQIRHLQYHVGHCNSILRDRGLEAVDWIDLD